MANLPSASWTHRSIQLNIGTCAQASGYRDRVVDVAEELVKFGLLLRGRSDFLVDRYRCAFVACRQLSCMKCVRVVHCRRQPLIAVACTMWKIDFNRGHRRPLKAGSACSILVVVC